MDLGAEHAALGAVLQADADGVMGLLATRLGRDDFFTEAHRAIYAAMLELHRRGVPVDHVTLEAALRDRGEFDSVGGAPKLAQLLEAGLLAIPVHVPSYIDQVLTASAKRELLQLGRQLSQGATNGATPADLIEALEHDVARLRGRVGRRPRALVSAAELAASPPAEPAWLVDQLVLEASNGWLGAGPKVGKSYLALDLLLSLAHGLAWLDHFAVLRPHVVVLVQEEDSRWRVYQRLERLCRGRGVAFPATLHVAVRTGIQLDEPASLEPFLQELAAVRPDLIVWDVFNRLHTKNERYPEQTLPLLRRVDRIRDTLGCANLIAHHSRKPGTHGPDLASGGQKLRGPSEFWGWAENSLYLAPLKGKGHVVVEPESKDAIVEPFKVHLEDLPDGGRRWVYDGVVEARLAAGEKNRAKILSAFDGAALDKQAIADRTGLSVRAVERYLPALEKDGVLDSYKEPGRAGRKLYLVPSEPAEQAAGGPAESGVPF